MPKMELRAVRRYRSVDVVEHRRLHAQLDAFGTDDPGRTVEATGPHLPVDLLPAHLPDGHVELPDHTALGSELTGLPRRLPGVHHRLVAGGGRFHGAAVPPGSR